MWYFRPVSPLKHVRIVDPAITREIISEVALRQGVLLVWISEYITHHRPSIWKYYGLPHYLEKLTPKILKVLNCKKIDTH